MMKKQLLTLAIIATALGGCVSNDDLAQVQSQVSHLQGKVNRLEGQLARSNAELVATKGELAVVKEQRVVRLPTGAPLEMRRRDEGVPATASTVSDENTVYNQAVQQYKSGDVQAAMSSFENFVASYPNSQYRNEALFYLGQAAYTSRDYYRAQQALEPLVLQPTNGQVSQPAARLLQSVYQAQGNTDDEAKLNEYLQSLGQPQAQMTPAPVETPAASVVETPATTAAPTAAEPTTAEAATAAAEAVQEQVERIVEKTEPKPVRPVFVTQ